MDVFSLVDRDVPSTEEIIQVFEALATVIQNNKSELSETLVSEIEKTKNEVSSQTNQTLEELDELKVRLGELVRKVKDLRLQKGDDGYTPIKGVDYFDGKDGKDYILTEEDRDTLLLDVLSQVPDPQDIAPEVIAEKVNQSKVLIKPSQVEGLSDIERIAKANAFAGDVRIGVSKTELKALEKRVKTIESNPSNGTGTVDSIVAGAGISVDSTDPANPIVSATGSGTGDMSAETYDPQNIADDAFDRANHTGTQAISTITNLQTSLDSKVDENAAITGATKTKITYDAKGLVTAGADATTADIADSTNKRYVTDAQLTVIGNTSGTNTGDQNLTPYFHKTNDDTDDITVGTTNKFATAAEKTKLGFITVTQAVDLDTIESDTATNNAKVSNATHTGEVTGSTALTVDKTAITGKTEVTATGTDYVLISDTSDSGNLKKALVSDLTGSGGSVAWGGITGTLADQTDLQTALDAKQDVLTGLTASVAELNILDGVTATAAELNALDGITATVTELNYTDGVTSAIQTQLNAKAPLASPTFTGTVTLPTGLTGIIRADSGVVSVDTDVTDIVSAASTTAAGKVELATDAETNTGTDTTRAITPSNLEAWTGSAQVTTVGTLASGAVPTTLLTGIIPDARMPDLTGDVTTSEGAVATTIANGAVTDAKISSTADVMLSTITFVIDGGGSAITTGIKGDLEIPFNCTINRATALADQSGSIVVDIWKDSYTNYPATDADSITASAPVTISTATKSQDTTLSGWTTTITAGDILRFNVDSASTVTRVTISLKVTKT